MHAVLVTGSTCSKQLLSIPSMIKDFSDVIKGLNGHPFAQLTAGACVAWLCLTGMTESTNKKQIPVPDVHCHVPLSTHFGNAVQIGIFDKILLSIHEAVLVSESARHCHHWCRDHTS